MAPKQDFKAFQCVDLTQPNKLKAHTGKRVPVSEWKNYTKIEPRRKDQPKKRT
jgi:hypothetical protein